MNRRFHALWMAMVLVAGLVVGAGPALAAEDTVTYKFYNYPSNTENAALNKSIGAITVASGTSVVFSGSQLSLSRFGYEFVSADPAQYAGTGAGAAVEVKVYVRVNIWPGFPGALGYPFDSYRSSSYITSQMPDVTVDWNGSSYTIPGWMVYEWVMTGNQTPLNAAGQFSSPLSSALPASASPYTRPNMTVGGRLQLTSSMLGGLDPKYNGIYFRSANDSIAMVTDDGMIIAMGTGTVRITAYTNNGRVYGSWEIVVGPKTTATTLSLNRTKATVRRNSDYRLMAFSQGLETDAYWKSSNTAIAQVNNGFVTTFDRKGKVTITATSLDGAASAKCTVTVK